MNERLTDAMAAVLVFYNQTFDVGAPAGRHAAMLRKTDPTDDTDARNYGNEHRLVIVERSQVLFDMCNRNFIAELHGERGDARRIAQ